MVAKNKIKLRNQTTPKKPNPSKKNPTRKQTHTHIHLKKPTKTATKKNPHKTGGRRVREEYIDNKAVDR